MELDFLVSCSHKMVDDVRGGSIASSAAEPLIARDASNNTVSAMYTAISSRVSVLA